MMIGLLTRARAARRAPAGFHTLVEMQRAACARYTDRTLFAAKDPSKGTLILHGGYCTKDLTIMLP